LSTEFFAPGTSTSPLSSEERRTTICMAYSVCSRGGL